MQEVLGRILKVRIERDKTNGTLDVTEMTKTLNILLAGGSISADQFTEFESML